MFWFVVFAPLVASISALHGHLDGRIVGGTDADIKDYPYQLSLQSYHSHICGATLISRKFAVTAAHCTDGHPTPTLYIVAGISNLWLEDGQRIQVAKVHQHPEFSLKTLDYDISVLELSGDVQLDEKRRPIPLVPDGSDPVEGTHVVVTGWGRTHETGGLYKQLQRVGVQIVARERCQKQIGFYKITERMICAGVEEGGKDACGCDSGGPLVAQGQLVGIVSWGYGCAGAKSPRIYTNVGALRKFISKVL